MNLTDPSGLWMTLQGLHSCWPCVWGGCRAVAAASAHGWGLPLQRVGDVRVDDFAVRLAYLRESEHF